MQAFFIRFHVVCLHLIVDVNPVLRVIFESYFCNCCRCQSLSEIISPTFENIISLMSRYIHVSC